MRDDLNNRESGKKSQTAPSEKKNSAGIRNGSSADKAAVGGQKGTSVRTVASGTKKSASEARQGTSGTRQSTPRRTPTELQAPLLKTRPSGQDRRTEERSASGRSDNTTANRYRRTSGGQAGRKATGRTGDRTFGNRRTTTDRTSAPARRQETPEEREIRLRRNKEMNRKRRRRKRVIRRARNILIIIAVAGALICTVVGVHRYRTKKAEEAAAEAAAAEAARTLQSYDASEVLHLSFHVLKLDDTADVDGDGVIDTEDDLIDADGDGIADEGTDIDDDGIPDVHDDLIDADGDGVADDDGDLDSDGIPDSEDDLIDADGDGVADLTVDTDGDGIADAAAGTATADEGLTVSEFNAILQELYDDNYVLVSPYALSSDGDSGMTESTVQVPKGKKPLIISEQDVNYSEGYDGCADKLILTEDGTVINSYTESDGTVSQGAADVISCVDEFIRENPDFSYDGARGIIGITGADGIFGYAIDEDTEIIGALSDSTISEVESDASGSGTDATTTEDTTTEDTTEEDTSDGTDTSASGYELSTEEAAESVTSSSAAVSGSSSDSAQSSAIQKAQEEHDTEIENNRSTLSELIETLRSEGWVFACNSYRSVSYASTYDIVKADVDDWMSNSGVLTGGTDLLLLPNGGDIGGWSGYTEDNQKFTYLKSLGFRYYFVDSSQSKTWIQVESDYTRQVMHDISSRSDYDKVMAL